MDKLEEARQDINEIDARMAELFVRRMEASARVLEYKREHDMPIFDAAREAAVIEKGLARVENGDLAGYYREFITAIMGISKEYQQALLDGGDRA